MSARNRRPHGRGRGSICGLVGDNVCVFFSELVDTAINVAVERAGKRGSAKGLVVTGADLQKKRKLFRLYTLVYPFVWALTRLDALVPASGYMLIAAARRRG